MRLDATAVRVFEIAFSQPAAATSYGKTRCTVEWGEGRVMAVCAGPPEVETRVTRADAERDLARERAS